MGKKSVAEQQINAILGKSKKKQQKGKKNRKLGRYGRHPSSMRYKGERRWIANRLKRMARHLKRFPADLQAKRLLAEFRAA